MSGPCTRLLTSHGLRFTQGSVPATPTVRHPSQCTREAAVHVSRTVQVFTLFEFSHPWNPHYTTPTPDFPISRDFRKNPLFLNGISVSRPPKIGERPYPRQFHPVEFARFQAIFPPLRSHPCHHSTHPSTHPTYCQANYPLPHNFH